LLPLINSETGKARVRGKLDGFKGKVWDIKFILEGGFLSYREIDK
jgi:hypothetical protein